MDMNDTEWTEFDPDAEAYERAEADAAEAARWACEIDDLV